MVYVLKTASVTELRQNATNLLKEIAHTHTPVFIFQNSKKAGVLLDEETYQQLLEAHMDARDYEIAQKALRNKREKVYTLDEIKKLRGNK